MKPTTLCIAAVFVLVAGLLAAPVMAQRVAHRGRVVSGITQASGPKMHLQGRIGTPFVAAAPHRLAVHQQSDNHRASALTFGPPDTYQLEANYPNPFNPQTAIRFALPEAGPVRLVVLDVLGREVAVLADGVQAAGAHTVYFDAQRLPSGVYLYRLDAPGFRQTRQMLLLK